MNDRSSFRPRFSIRTLFIVLTLLCVYFGSWEGLKERAVADASEDFFFWQIAMVGSGPTFVTTHVPYVLHEQGEGYYVWLFGFTAPLSIFVKHPLVVAGIITLALFYVGIPAFAVFRCARPWCRISPHYFDETGLSMSNPLVSICEHC